MADYVKILTDDESKMTVLIEEANKALSKGDVAEAGRVIEKLADAETDYATDKKGEVFDQLKDSGEPVLNAVKMLTYPVLKHKKNLDNGVLRSVEMTTRMVYIDLVALCRYCGLPTDWRYSVDRLNQLLTLRLAQDVHATKEEIDAISTSFYMKEEARKIDLGKTPTSTTQICKALQTVIDKVLFVPDEKGENTVKAHNRDVAWVLSVHSKHGKEARSTATAKNGIFQRYLLEAMNRIVTERPYSVEFARVKSGS